MSLSFFTIYFIVVFTTGALLLLRWHLANNRNYFSLYERGLESFQEEKYKKARRFFSAALSKNPEFQDARYNLGLTYLNLNNYKKARKCFELFLDVVPNDFDATYQLGLTCIKLNEFASARSCFEKILVVEGKEKDRFGVVFNMGLACHMIKSLDEAETYYLQAMELDSDDIAVQLNLAQVYLFKHEYTKSLNLYTKINNEVAGRGDVLYGIARCQDELCKYNSELEVKSILGQYEAVDDRADKPEGVKIYLARAYAKAGMLEKALTVSLEASDLYPRHPVLNRLLGLIYLLTNKLNAAEELLDKLLRLNKNDAEACHLLAYVYLKKGDAIQHVELKSRYRKLLNVKDSQLNEV